MGVVSDGGDRLVTGLRLRLIFPGLARPLDDVPYAARGPQSYALDSIGLEGIDVLVSIFHGDPDLLADLPDGHVLAGLIGDSNDARSGGDLGLIEIDVVVVRGRLIAQHDGVAVEDLEGPVLLVSRVFLDGSN